MNIVMDGALKKQNCGFPQKRTLSSQTTRHHGNSIAQPCLSSAVQDRKRGIFSFSLMSYSDKVASFKSHECEERLI